MAMESGDLNSLRVEMDLARQPPAPPAVQAPGPGPEMVEEIAAGTGGGGLAGPPVAVTSYPGIADGSVLLAPPGFTVCESFFDSGAFICFNPEVVFGTETRLLPDGSFLMGDDVWCNVTIENGRIKSAVLENFSDAEATVSVHIADIRADGVKQYHVGAIVVSEGGAGVTPDDVSTEFIPEPEEGEEPTGDEGKLQIKGWAGGEPLANHSLAEILSGREVTGEMSPSFDRDAYVIVRCTDGSLAYVQIGKVLTDGASVEFKSDSTTGNLVLQVKGFDAASTGQVPVKRDNAIVWAAQSGGVEIGTPNVVQITTEWVGPSHADFAQHPYTLKIVRGTLAYDQNRKLIVQEIANLAQYIATTPLSGE